MKILQVSLALCACSALYPFSIPSGLSSLQSTLMGGASSGLGSSFGGGDFGSLGASNAGPIDPLGLSTGAISSDGSMSADDAAAYAAANGLAAPAGSGMTDDFGNPLAPSLDPNALQDPNALAAQPISPSTPAPIQPPGNSMATIPGVVINTGTPAAPAPSLTGSSGSISTDYSGSGSGMSPTAITGTAVGGATGLATLGVAGKLMSGKKKTDEQASGDDVTTEKSSLAAQKATKKQIDNQLKTADYGDVIALNGKPAIKFAPWYVRMLWSQEKTNEYNAHVAFNKKLIQGRTLKDLRLIPEDPPIQSSDFTSQQRVVLSGTPQPRVFLPSQSPTQATIIAHPAAQAVHAPQPTHIVVQAHAPQTRVVHLTTPIKTAPKPIIRRPIITRTRVR